MGPLLAFRDLEDIASKLIMTDLLADSETWPLLNVSSQLRGRWESRPS